jgi:hypothetical protein
MTDSRQQISAHEKCALLRRRLYPLATTARAAASLIHLSSQLEVSFPPGIAQGLEHATPAALRDIEISPSGFGILFPRLDADLYLPALLEGFFGSTKWMAASLGQLGGRSKSRAKRAASQRNGALGGRPPKRRRTANPAANKLNELL